MYLKEVIHSVCLPAWELLVLADDQLFYVVIV
jgi:hypothetical protein